MRKLIPILILAGYVGCDGPAPEPTTQTTTAVTTAALEGASEQALPAPVVEVSPGDEVPPDQQVTADPPAPIAPVTTSYDPATLLSNAANDPRVAAALATLERRPASGERATVSPKPRDEEHCTTGVGREGALGEGIAPTIHAVAVTRDRSDVPLTTRLAAAPASDLAPSANAVVGPAEPTPFSY